MAFARSARSADQYSVAVDNHVGCQLYGAEADSASNDLPL